MVQTDQRIFERFKVHFPVRFKNSLTQVYGQSVSYDISAGGIRIREVEYNLKPQEPMILWIDVPDGRGAICKAAKVVWIRLETLNTIEVGLEFEQIRLVNLWRIFDRRRARSELI